MLFGGFSLGGVLSGVQGLEQAEEAGSFADAAELDAEGLNFDEEVLHVDDLVSDQRLKEDADQPDQTVLRKHRQTETEGGTRCRTVGMTSFLFLRLNTLFCVYQLYLVLDHAVKVQLV